MEVVLEKKYRSFNGFVEYYSHVSNVTNTKMNFSLYRPDGLTKTSPVLYWLSGLTCTEENFQIKAGASRVLSETGCLLVCPDTSPRGLNLPGEHESYDFGSGAGFYLDATEAPWNSSYRMESYIVTELLDLVQTIASHNDQKRGLFGHSMGGHGALTLGLKYPDKFSSLSAFSPILHPIKSPWGKKAFSAYLGGNEESWKNHDFIELLKSSNYSREILIDQGMNDEFLSSQLGGEYLEQLMATKNYSNIRYRKQAGFDHSYYFISTFIEEHLHFHLNMPRS
jgi:S-formylglutathione hydrolase